MCSLLDVGSDEGMDEVEGSGKDAWIVNDLDPMANEYNSTTNKYMSNDDDL